MTKTENKIITNGRAIAAILSAMIGLLIMGIINTATEASADFNTWVLNIGKLWIPNATGIGPYSGKETFLLIGWLGSWALLHFTLRKRNIKTEITALTFIIGIAIATLLVYTPFIDLLLGK